MVEVDGTDIEVLSPIWVECKIGGDFEVELAVVSTSTSDGNVVAIDEGEVGSGILNVGPSDTTV